jgi:hypothetical protein
LVVHGGDLRVGGDGRVDQLDRLQHAQLLGQAHREVDAHR